MHPSFPTKCYTLSRKVDGCKPFWSHLPVPPCLIDWGKVMYPSYSTKCAYVDPKSGRV